MSFFQRSLPLVKKAVGLGRLVLNPHEPGDDYFDLSEKSSVSDTAAQDLIPKTTGPMPFKHLDEVLGSSSDADFSAILTKYASVYFSQGEKSAERLLASRGFEEKVLNSGDWFKTLCRDNAARVWMEEQLMRGKGMYLVTGYRSVVNAEFTAQASQDIRAGGEVVAPPGEIASSVPGFGVRLQGTDGSSEASKNTVTFLGERIIQIGYRQVQFRWYSSKKVDNAFLEDGNRWYLRLTLAEEPEDDEDDILEANLSSVEDIESAADTKVIKTDKETYVFKIQKYE